ncbi:class I SAM-dependent methyltransferase [Nocardia elegans]|uniref:S-adenosyl-L-methionine-dependent methyltransferase n=1 Tax=Nocardia nova TaxID=37330 RepID=A0A2T2Z279_9NOCA|nr:MULTISPECIES: class I SAM-dependent methyltransferase [Nocardia]MBF6245829.1 class I SAM-dependent methyltransferase [Nocardia elegans]MBF6450845.1 class I SAM-dependent methyltransferase [Nocardia elegans]PSR61857.1 SAM-dependent methyltransferase [Nocardia nova]
MSVRSDDDSWDITESVGATAIGVAAMRAAETRRPDALFRDPYAARLVEAAGSGWSHIMRAQVAATSAGADPAGEGEPAYSSLAAMLIARTVYFDEYFAAASAAGIRQVVILASGLDARAYRLEWPSGTVVFEIDQPKVLEFKNSVLADEQPAVDRRAIGVDLRQDWPKELWDNGFDPTAPTAWLAEGLLRYLPGEAQDRLFGDIAALSAPGSRIALNIGRGRREDSPALQAMRERRKRLLAEAGITLNLEELWYPWEGRTDPRDWFTAHGWAVTAGDPVAVLSDHGREQPEAARAELNRHILMTATRGDENR